MFCPRIQRRRIEDVRAQRTLFALQAVGWLLLAGVDVWQGHFLFVPIFVLFAGTLLGGSWRKASAGEPFAGFDWIEAGVQAWVPLALFATRAFVSESTRHNPSIFALMTVLAFLPLVACWAWRRRRRIGALPPAADGRRPS